MKRNLFLLLVVLSGLRAAAQINGGEIDYRCLGNGRYEVIAHINYRCGAAPQIPSIRCLAGADTLYADSIAFYRYTNLPQPPAGCQFLDSCTVIQNHKKTVRVSYRGVFNLDTVNACEIRFFVREPIQNLNGNLIERSLFYIETLVDRCLVPCGASPVSKGLISPYVFSNLPVSLSGAVFNALFPDDSFVYSFAPIRQYQNVTAVYWKHYDSIRWIRFFGFPDPDYVQGGMWLNRTSGIINFHAHYPERAAFVLKVAVYRTINGTRRLVEIKYIENTLEVLTSVPNSGPFISIIPSLNVCHGQKGCVRLQAEDHDLGDSLFIEVYTDSFPELEVTYQRYGRLHECEVCWTADSTKVGNGHPFYLLVRDNHCPLPISYIFKAPMYVQQSPEASRTVLPVSGGVSLTMTPFHPYPDLLNEWRIYDAFQQSVFSSSDLTANKQLNPGKYIVHLKLISSGCFTRYIDTLDVPVPSALGDPGTIPLLYPNPFSESVYLEGKDVTGVTMFNSPGQRVAVRLESNGEQWEIIPLNGTRPGIYWLRVETQQGIYMEKVVRE